MSEITHVEALRQADALIGQTLRETEARCAVLGQYINDCENKGSRAAAWGETTVVRTQQQIQIRARRRS
jgi:hypothetical protein